MEACHKTIGSFADMLPSKNIEDVIETIILNNCFGVSQTLFSL